MTTATAHTSASARDILNAQSTKHREYHPTHCHPPREGARFVVHGSHMPREVSAGRKLVLAAGVAAHNKWYKHTRAKSNWLVFVPCRH